MATKVNERVAAWLVGHPKVVGAFLIAVFAASLVALPHLRSEAGVGVYFDRTRPLQKSVDEIAEHFVGDDVVFVVYGAPDVFAAPALREVRELGVVLEGLFLEDGGERRVAVEDVRSLATVDDLTGAEGSYRTEPLVPDPVPEAQEALAQIRARALRNPLLVDRLVAPDARVAAMAVRLVDGLDDADGALVVQRIRDELAARRGVVERWELVGKTPLQTDIARYQQEDVQRFIPIVYAVLGLLLFSFLRKTRGVLMSLANVLVALAAAFATLVLTGSSLNNTSAMLPPAIMALNVALLVHYFSEYEVTDGRPRHHTLGELLVPIFMAELTTAIGFAGLASTNIPAVRDFGIAAAAAVGVSFVTAVCMVSVATARWEPTALASRAGLLHSPRLLGALAALTEWVLRRWAWVGLGAIALTVLLGAGVARVVVDQNNLELFDERAPIRRATIFMDEHLGGSTLVVATVRSATPGAFFEPTELRKLDELAAFLKDELGADVVDSPTDYVKLMHRELMGGADSEYRLPDTRAQVAQLLLVNGDTRLDEYLDEERRSVRLVARTSEHSVSALYELYERLDGYLATRFPESAGYRAVAAADSRLEATLAEELIAGQVSSTVWSALPIFALMFLMLRSVALGVVSLIPNVFPLFANFGLMGWLGIRLSMATVMISTVALGIVVDDTVHFLMHMRGRLQAHGDVDRAVRETMAVKGAGMVGTTSILALVFAVLLASNFNPTRDFALLMAIVMLAALASDMLLMPAALAAARRVPWLRLRTFGEAARTTPSPLGESEPSS